MKIPFIFYEEEKAKELLNGGSLDFISFPMLVLLAKYFKSIGKNNQQTRKSLLAFCYEHNSGYNEILGRGALENALKKAQKFNLRSNKPISITKNEMLKIRSAETYKKQKVLFVLLVLAKFFKENNNRIKPQPSKNDHRYFASATWNNVFTLAKINCSKKERNTIQYELERDGFIKTIRNNSFEVLFHDENDEVEMIVDDYHDLIGLFPCYCSKCGIKIERKSKRHEMCESCYQEDLKERQRKFSRESMKNIRKNTRC